MMHPDVERVLIDEQELDTIISRIAAEIDRDYQDKHLVLVCVLKGSIVFMGELMKKLTVPVEIEVMRASSYFGGTRTNGSPIITVDFSRKNPAMDDVLIVEDIIDSGKTLDYLCKHLKTKGVRSVKTVTLLDKPERRAAGLENFEPDYRGKIIPDEFVIGFGLDYNEKYRQLPYVGVLKREIYE